MASLPLLYKTVDGLHDPLIKARVFYEVQDVLEGRKRKTATKIVTQHLLALKGFVKWPKCGKVSTGSASKGRTAHYNYYHCNSACGCRTRADEANSIFEEHLKDFVLKADAATLFKTIIMDVYKNEHLTTASSRKQYTDRITALNNKVTKARELLLNDDIEAADFRAVKWKQPGKYRYRKARSVSCAATEWVLQKFKKRYAGPC